LEFGMLPELSRCVRRQLHTPSAVSVEPGKRSFDNRPAWQQLKASRISRAFDDLNGPVPELGEGVT